MGYTGRPASRLVVQRDVAGDDGGSEGGTGVRDAGDNGLHLEVDVGALRVPEVQAVGDGYGEGAGADDVARGLCHRDGAALVRVDVAVPAVAVCGDGDPASRALDPKDGGVRACFDDGVRADALVVLAVDPVLAGDVGRGEEPQESRVRVSRLRHLAEVHALHLVQFVGRYAVSRVFGRFDEKRDGQRGDFAVAVDDVHDAVVGDVTDDRRRNLPALEEAGDVGLVATLDDDDHAFLGLGEHDFVRGHAVFAARHLAHVEHDASAATVGGLDRGGGKSGGTAVLDTGDPFGVVLGEVDAGFEEHLLEERVADLHGGAHLLEASTGVGAGGEAGRAVDAVATGVGADDHDDVAGALGLGAGQAIDGGDADAHGVDERVRSVGVFEVDLAADSGNAEAVAVAADPGDDALEQVAVVRVIEGAEAERVQQGDRARAHREDVADDAADAGGRALVRLDRRGVVVRFDLHDDAEAVADLDCAGVFLAAVGENVSALGGEQAQQRLRVLVAAVLAPEGAEEPEFDLVWLAAKLFDDQLVLRPGEGDGVERGLVDAHVVSIAERWVGRIGMR